MLLQRQLDANVDRNVELRQNQGTQVARCGVGDPFVKGRVEMAERKGFARLVALLLRHRLAESNCAQLGRATKDA